VIHREWRNTHGHLHRTTEPAAEEWTVLPDGAHVLLFQGWYLNGNLHREGRPAYRSWHVAVDGIGTLVHEGWYQHGRRHAVGGPTYRSWHVEPDGTRTLTWEEWCVNGKLQRVDGPAYLGQSFHWHDVQVREEALPWLRRGRSLLVTLAAFTGATATMRRDGGAGGSGVSPAWSRDGRVTTVTWHGGGAGDAVVPAYRSAVGGSVLLCV